MDCIPATLPALLYALKVQRRAEPQAADQSMKRAGPFGAQTAGVVQPQHGGGLAVLCGAVPRGPV